MLEHQFNSSMGKIAIKKSFEVSEAVELLACERKILEFLHKDSEHHYDNVKPITQVSLFELRKRIQEKKDGLKGVNRASDND